MSRPRRPRPIRDVMLVLTAASVAGAVVVLIGFALAELFNGLVAVYGVLLVVLGYGWAAYALLKYRQGRQDELLELLASAVAANVPLAPAVRAYVRERPRGNAREVLEALATFFVFPGYYWLWHRRHRFDYRAEQLADLLDEGMPLTDALRTVPVVASRETRLAAAVGETTGKLSVCLRRADRERMTTAWLELAPRVLYPVVVAWFVFGIATFNAFAIAPRMKKIYEEFGGPGRFPVPLPSVTLWLIEVGSLVTEYGFLFAPMFAAGGLLAVMTVANPAVRWHLPLFRWIYRSEVQGQILRLLGSQVEAGRPIPDALWRLSEAAEFPPVVRRALGRAGQASDLGEPLATALNSAGLLPGGMVALVQAAEKTGTLAWTLGELGDHLGTRSVRRVRRVSLVIAPLSVIAVGLMVGFVALGMFAPIIDLLEHVSE